MRAQLFPSIGGSPIQGPASSHLQSSGAGQKCLHFPSAPQLLLMSRVTASSNMTSDSDHQFTKASWQLFRQLKSTIEGSDEHCRQACFLLTDAGKDHRKICQQSTLAKIQKLYVRLAMTAILLTQQKMPLDTKPTPEPYKPFKYLWTLLECLDPSRSFLLTDVPRSRGTPRPDPQSTNTLHKRQMLVGLPSTLEHQQLSSICLSVLS